MNTDIQISQLRTFLAVVDEGGFAAAAIKVGRTQSAVTQQMQKLEASVGKALFRPKGRKRELTPAGLTLVRYGREIVSMSRHALSAITESSGGEILRVGSPHELTDAFLPPALALFNETWPGIRVVLHVDRSPTLMTMLQESRLDVAFTTRRSSHLEGSQVHTLQSSWLAAPKFKWDPLAPLPLVLTDEPSLFRQITLAALDMSSIPYVERFTSPTITGLKPAIVAGLGVTVRPVISFPKEVVVLDETDGLPPLPKVAYYCYQGPDSSSRHVQDFLEVLSRIKGSE